MKRLFSNKINIFLVTLLFILLGALGFFAYKVINSKNIVLVPNFKDKTIIEVNQWCDSFEMNPCTITQEYSDSIDKEYVIYQSISADEEMGDSISFIISLGKKLDINVPVIDKDTNREAIENWVKENGLLNVNYIQQESETIEKGIIIKIEPQIIESLETIVNVYISSGSNVSNRLIEIRKDTYVNLSVSDFESKVKELGLKPIHADSKDDYSNIVKKGNIVWHGSGEYENKEEIRYGICLGEDTYTIEVVKGTMVGLSLDEFIEQISKLGSKGLKAKYNKDNDSYSSTVEKDHIVWHGSGKYSDEEEISYGLSLGEDKNKVIISYGSYLNMNVEDFKSRVDKLGLKPNHNESKDEYSNTISKGLIVWHGAGEYVDGETINYSVSLGREGSDKDEIVIKEGEYIGKSFEEFKKEVELLGLIPNHRSEWDKEAGTNENNSVCRNGYGTYTKGENISYGLYTNGSDEIVIKEGQFKGKTLTEFKSEVEKLGLIPSHRSEWDIEDKSKATNILCRNGYGSYIKGENISYGLYKGGDSPTPSSDEIVISKGQYIGKSLDEFIKIVEALGLKPEHSEVYSDDYSSSIKKGCLDWHGSGSYTKGEVIHYTLSLGIEEKIQVNSGYEGKSVNEFETYIKGLGLVPNKTGSDYSETIANGLILSYSSGNYSKGSTVNYVVSSGSNPNVSVDSGLEGKSVSSFRNSVPNSLNIEHDSSMDKYSSYDKDTICSYNSGTYKKGDTIKYGLSLGKEPLSINTKDFYNNYYGVNCHSFDEMKAKMQSALSGFANVSYESCTSRDRDPGMIEKIKVNGSTSYEPGKIDADTPIVIYIVSVRETQ